METLTIAAEIIPVYMLSPAVTIMQIKMAEEISEQCIPHACSRPEGDGSFCEGEFITHLGKQDVLLGRGTGPNGEH